MMWFSHDLTKMSNNFAYFTICLGYFFLRGESTIIRRLSHDSSFLLLHFAFNSGR